MNSHFHNTFKIMHWSYFCNKKITSIKWNCLS